jgi:hypothetical protein
LDILAQKSVESQANSFSQATHPTKKKSFSSWDRLRFKH